MKKIVVACGNGVATSQTVAYKVNKMLEKDKINARVEAVNLRSLETELNNADAYIEIMVTGKEITVPKINGLAFLSGNKEQKEEEYNKLKQIIFNDLKEKQL